MRSEYAANLALSTTRQHFDPRTVRRTPAPRTFWGVIFFWL